MSNEPDWNWVLGRMGEEIYHGINTAITPRPCFKQFKKGGGLATLNLKKVDGWWPDNQVGTVVLILGNEVWISDSYEEFSKEMEAVLTDE